MLLLAAAICTDLLRRIIPNTLICTGAIGGLIYHLMAAVTTVEGFLFSISGLLVGGLLLIWPYSRSWVGGGDVKLLAMLGTWVGPATILRVFVCTTLVGGLMAAVQIIRSRRTPGRVGSSRRDLPYALAMGGGYALTLLGVAFF